MENLPVSIIIPRAAGIIQQSNVNFQMSSRSLSTHADINAVAIRHRLACGRCLSGPGAEQILDVL